MRAFTAAAGRQVLHPSGGCRVSGCLSRARPSRCLSAVAAAAAGGQPPGAAAAEPPTRQAHAALQAAYFDRAITSLQASITPEVDAKLARVAAAVPGLGAASRVLDAGAGEGALLPHLLAAGARDILAVDICPTMLEALQQRVGPASTLGNDPCMRTWLGDVVDLPVYQVGLPVLPTLRVLLSALSVEGWPAGLCRWMRGDCMAPG